MIVEAAHHDVTALVETEPPRRRLPQHRLGHRSHPGAGGVDQDARGHHVALAARVEDQTPQVTAFGAHAARAGADRRAALGSIDGVDHDQARIVGKAIGIFVAIMEATLERLPHFVGDQIECARARQNLPPSDQVVDEKAEPHRER